MLSELGLEYSLKTVFENELEITSVIFYNGVKHPNIFPHMFVKLTPYVTRAISKGNETYVSVMNFELTLHDSSLNGMRMRNMEILELMRFMDIPYYTEEGVLTDRTFSINNDEIFVSPVEITELDDTSLYYTVTYDISITTSSYKRGSKYNI